MNLPYDFIDPLALIKIREFYITQVLKNKIAVINAEKFEIKFLIDFGANFDINLIKTPNLLYQASFFMNNSSFINRM